MPLLHRKQTTNHIAKDLKRRHSSSIITTLLATFLITIAMSSSSQATLRPLRFYVVQPGDTASSILRALNFRPLYGSNGSIENLFSCDLNKHLAQTLNPGDRIFINFTYDARFKNLVRVKKNGEIIINKEWMMAQTQKGMFKKLGPKLNATHSPNFDHICEPKPLDVAPQEKTTIESTPALTPALTPTSTSTSTTEQAFSPVQIPLALPQTATQKEEIFHESEIGFVTTGGYIRHDLDTIFGGNATLVSPLLPGINIHWREKLSENWSTEMQFEYQNTKIQAPPNTEVIGISPHTKFGLNGLKTFAGNSFFCFI